MVFTLEIEIDPLLRSVPSVGVALGKDSELFEHLVELGPLEPELGSFGRRRQSRRSRRLLSCIRHGIGIDHVEGECPDIPSATQWTSAIDLTNRRVYYKTAYNNTIRCIDLSSIDFGSVGYQSHPLDRMRQQPVEMIAVGQ